MTPSNFNLLIVFRQFHGSDEQHSTEIISTDVMIIPSAGNHDKSSSHVKTNNIVDHSWDVRFYKGQLLAVHLSGKFIAFGIQGEFSYFWVHIMDMHVEQNPNQSLFLFQWFPKVKAWCA